jgi:hypothetical protein
MTLIEEGSYSEEDSDPQLQTLLHELSPAMIIGGIFSVESESALQGLLANEEVRQDCLSNRQVVALLGYRGLLGIELKSFADLGADLSCSAKTMRLEYWKAIEQLRRYYKSVEVEAVPGPILFAHMLPE